MSLKRLGFRTALVTLLAGATLAAHAGFATITVSESGGGVPTIVLSDALTDVSLTLTSEGASFDAIAHYALDRGWLPFTSMLLLRDADGTVSDYLVVTPKEPGLIGDGDRVQPIHGEFASTSASGEPPLPPDIPGMVTCSGFEHPTMSYCYLTSSVPAAGNIMLLGVQSDVAPVPEPPPASLLALGLAAMFAWRFRCTASSVEI